MAILHVINYDLHYEDNFLNEPHNGLERFVREFYLLDKSQEHIFLHINDLYYLSSLSISYVDKEDGYQRVLYPFISLDNKEKWYTFFDTVKEMYSVENILFHYVKYEFIALIESSLSVFDYSMLIMHDANLLSETGGIKDDYVANPQLGRLFQYVDDVVCVSDFLYQKVISLYPVEHGKIRCIENDLQGLHNVHLNYVQSLQKPFHQKPLHVAILGNITAEIKGSKIIEELLEISNEAIEYSIVGRASEAIQKKMNGKIYPYTSNTLEKVMEELQPDVVVIPSIWAEAFGFTALEASYLGFPVVSFSVGDLTRIERRGLGWNVTEISSKALYTMLLELLTYTEENWYDLLLQIDQKMQKKKISMVEEYVALCQKSQYSYDYDKRKKHKDRALQQYVVFAQQNYVLKSMYVEERTTLENIVKKLQSEITENWKEIHKFQRRQIKNKIKKTLLKSAIVRKSIPMIRRIKEYIQKHGSLSKAFRALIIAFRKYGYQGFVRRLWTGGHGGISYENWMNTYEKKMLAKDEITSVSMLSYKPLISILVPVYNVEEHYLRACIDSVLQQTYETIELCLVDDASTQPHIRPVLEEYAEKDNRVKVIFREKNGHISEASNTGISECTGEFIGLLDNDDVLTKNAIYEVVRKLNEDSSYDLIYSDEDKLTANGKRRLDPMFKPDWSPDAFLGHMYICHFSVYRTSFLKSLGGFRKGYEGAQDYDLALRAMEQTKHIGHIPKILYHWRMIPTSTAAGSGAKNYAFDAAMKAKKDMLHRQNTDAYFEEDSEKSISNIVYNLAKEDKISIIIPTRNHGEDIQKCIDSIYEKSVWRNFEIILVDNGSDEEASILLFEEYERKYTNFKRLILDIPFNYSKLNNEAVKISTGNLLLFLNNDTEVITEDFLMRMGGHAKQEHTGAVGAFLYYPDDTIQHAGVIGMNNIPGHAFHGFGKKEYGYAARLLLNYNYSAVTAACLMVDKEKFLSVGGFNEEDLTVAFNDVDVCYKLYKKGYFNVCRHDVKLYHYESKSRGYDTTKEKQERFEKELAYMRLHYEDLMTDDPFYNPNLTRRSYKFTYREE